MDQPVFLARAGDLDPGIELLGHDRLEQVDLPDGVDHERLGRKLPGGRDEALGGQVEDPVRAGGGQRFPQGAHVLEVGFIKGDFPRMEERGDVLHPAPPADEAVDLDAGMMGQDVLGQVAARETGDSRDQNVHVMFNSIWPEDAFRRWSSID